MASLGLMPVPQKVLLMWSHKELIKHLSEAETEGKNKTGENVLKQVR